MKLTAAMKAEILQHAKDEFPRECCGLVAVIKGRRKYFRCQNIAETPDEHFILSGWNVVEDQGEVVAIVHSHPKTNPEPSVADKVACEKSELPWFIVNPNTEAWASCEPTGFELPYVGREFSFGVIDCYTLVRDWYKREMGVKLRDWDRPVSADAFRRSPLFESCLTETGFVDTGNDLPEKGDAVLMRLDGSPGLNHVAIFVGEQKILHQLQGRLSSRDRWDSYW